MPALLTKALFRMAQSLAQKIIALLQVANAPTDGVGQLSPQSFELAVDLNPVRAQQFGRRRGRCRAVIGNKIGNRDIDFMAHGADDWQSTGKDRAGHRFFIKTPKVLQRSATASD